MKPHLLTPRGARTSWTLPTFGWTPVRRADHYEFQLAADARFNAPVLGGDGSFTTRNTRATIRKTPPNGRYWWRVRAVTKDGQVSRWAVGSVVKNWNVPPQPVSPANGGAFNYPTEPLVLSWTAVPGAARYRVSIAADPTFATPVAGAPLETTATSVNPPSSLPLGTYYWRVTPLDPEKNIGASSPVRSFRWSWPSTTTTFPVRDLAVAPELYDPQLSWAAVPGAAHYELDINTSTDFAPGSRICCPITTATKYSPPQLLDNNTYYWRVRAIDIHGNAGDWVRGAPFTKTFDNVPPVVAPSIKNLHVRSANSDPGVYVPGYTTSSPILVWSPVPGASAYQVIVVGYFPTTGGCDWAGTRGPKWDTTTAITSWTPLGSGRGHEPYPAASVSIESDGASLDDARVTNHTFCARVRALSDSGQSGRVYGDFAYLGDGGDGFVFSGYDPGSPATPSITAGDYYTPASSPAQSQTPVFTWRAIPGAASYWVLVSRDPSFTTLIDYAFTRMPAYAPRRTYSDETTDYYWAVLPSGSPDGSTFVASDPHLTAIVPFEKRSTPPSLLAPAAGALVGAEQPTFEWTPVQGARYYTLQVSFDPTFGSLLDSVDTDSTAYTSNTTYPPEATLYWRVRANDENRIGLTWSSSGSFTHSLPAPVLSDANARIGEAIPVWLWTAVPGAVQYDLHAVLPDGSTRDVEGLPSPAFVASLIAGNGFFRWNVRAEFPRAGGTTPGPYSDSQVFTKILAPPAGLRAIRGPKSLVFQWAAKTTARNYRFQIARHPDFSNMVDSVDTESNVYAPLLQQDDYLKGGRFYWRVAGIDDYGNQGKFSKALVLRLPRRLHR